jgi:hypothetical protein
LEEPTAFIVLTTVAAYRIILNPDLAAATGAGAPYATYGFALTKLNSANLSGIKTGGITRSKTVADPGTFSFPQITDLTSGTYYLKI